MTIRYHLPSPHKDWEEWFVSEARCPLFGELPPIDPPPSTSEGRCFEIIDEARLMLGVGAVGSRAYSGRSGERKNWPEVRDVPGYPENVLNSVRAVYRRNAEITSSASHYDPTCGWYDTEDGGQEQTLSADQVNEARVIQFARQSIGCDRDAPEFLIFATLAINYAWNALQDLLVRYIDVKPESIHPDIYTAQGFLEKARRFESREHRDEEVQERLDEVVAIRLKEEKSAAAQRAAEARHERPRQGKARLQADYRTLRTMLPDATRKELIEKVYDGDPIPRGATKWATDADREDGFVRSPGRPKQEE